MIIGTILVWQTLLAFLWYAHHEILHAAHRPLPSLPFVPIW